MANTSTIDLVKPAGTDYALISMLNSNSDKIDAEAARVRNNFAGTYDATASYAVGDYCVYSGDLYRCTTAISGGEAWNSSHWEQVSAGSEVKALNGNKTNTFESAIVIDNNTCVRGASIGQYVIVRNSSGISDGLYTVVHTISAGATGITPWYLTSVNDGGLNSLNHHIATLNAIMEITHPIVKATSGAAATLKFTFTGNRYTALMLRTDNQNDRMGVYALTFKQNGSKNVVSLVGANTSDITIDNDGSINIVSSAWSSVVLIPTSWTDFS